MTAFTATTGDNYFDGYSGGSTNATLDSYAISGGARLIVRSDTYACPNHTAALAGTTEKAGSTITFKGLDGTTDRIVGSFDAENNRTGAVLDGS